MDVRSRRLQGSEAILTAALQDKKAWTRLYAAIGLAELNSPPSVEQVEQALGRERSELLANFFERFVGRSTAAQRYVMRHALRLLDERGRLVVLRALLRADDAYRPLYVVAATQDPGLKVQRWVRQALPRLRLTAATEAQLLQVVRGTLPAAAVLQGAAALPPLEKAAAEAKAESKKTAPATIETVADFEDFEDSIGDVEFYDDASGETMQDAQDKQTFDLQE
jgi:hypothetical protein